MRVAPNKTEASLQARSIMARAAAFRTDAHPIALWSLAFRPFFLAASLWAALALLLWMILFVSGIAFPSRFDPLTWHIHAMLFGFVLAAIAGFILTAIPNWTGRTPVGGGRLVALVTLWLIGRIACVMSAFLPLWLAAAIDIAFPVALCGVAVCEIVAARNWRNLMIPVPIGVLAIADLLMYLELAGFDIPPGFGWRLALAAAIALLSAIGGRIIPPFTRNWLVSRGSALNPVSHRWLDRLALVTLHGGLLGWAFLPASRPIGGVLLLAAILNLWRLAGWRGFATASEPLLSILHVGYGWVVLGAALLGASMLSDIVPEPAAIHAFTAGAIGTMVLAVMTRVSRGHTGRALEADGVTISIYTIVVIAGLARVAAAFADARSVQLLEISALLWVTSFGLFAISYGPMLISPRANHPEPLDQR
jgi:uncharacterized protein involved in response to NO